jgi:DsbC/DsbD-like thiol-disulfide interchange protein
MIDFANFGRPRTICALITGAAALFCLAAASTADIPSHVTATGTVSPKVVKAGGKGILTVKLVIASGFHINAVKPLESYLVPTDITVSGLSGVVFGSPVYPVPVTIKEGTDKVVAYEGTTLVKIPFTVKAGAKSGKVLGTVDYQACTTASCFPPTTAKFTTSVSVK